MADRGDYRSLFCSFWDDADVHALSHLAYRVLTTLKGTLSSAGLGIVYPGVLATRCGATVEEIETTLVALERPAPGKDHGWIVRERNAVWIVNGLRFEPNLTHTNSRHQKFVANRALAPLASYRRIIDGFRAHYPEWFPGPNPDPSAGPKTPPKPPKPAEPASKGDQSATNPEYLSDRVKDASAIPPDTLKDGSGYPIGNLSKQSPARSQPVTVTIPAQAVASKALATAAADGASAEEEPPADLRPVDYAVGLCTAANLAIAERFGEQPTPILPTGGAAQQLAADLIEARVPLEFARAAIVARIRGATLDKPPTSIRYFTGAIADAVERDRQRSRDRQSSIPAEPRRGGSPTRIDRVLQAEAAQAHDQQLEFYERQRKIAGQRWALDAANADALVAITDRANHQFEEWATNNFARTGRDLQIAFLCADAAGFPSFEVWSAQSARQSA